MIITVLGENQNIETLNETLNDKKVVLDFYADWCGPCKTLTKTLNNLIKDEKLENVHIIKVDVEKHNNIARQFNVRAMPTLIFMKNGKNLHTKVGAPSETIFKELIEQVYE